MVGWSEFFCSELFVRTLVTCLGKTSNEISSDINKNARSVNLIVIKICVLLVEVSMCTFRCLGWAVW